MAQQDACIAPAVLTDELDSLPCMLLARVLIPERLTRMESACNVEKELLRLQYQAYQDLAREIPSRGLDDLDPETRKHVEVGKLHL
jgi:hypothetical protein